MPNIADQEHDIVIIGAGILGLWAAEFALRAGRKVLVLEARHRGAGASGGLLGALMPHQPVGWSAKKALQYEGLTRLPLEIKTLEHATGLNCHYRQPGRVMPIRKEGQKIQSKIWAEGALENWPESHGMQPEWHVKEPTSFSDHWPDQWYRHSNASLGVNFDTLAACVDPQRLLTVLAHSVEQKGGQIVEQCPVSAFDKKGQIILASGQQIQPKQLLVAAGYESFPLVKNAIGEDLGMGVKGQSLIVKPSHNVDPAWPVIYDNGLYLIARPDGTVAIGSTSENNWTEPNAIDDQCDALFERAKMVSPILENAEILTRWAGIRPKTHSREPYFGHLSDCQQVFLLTGGFKITIGIAHIMSKRLMNEMNLML